MRYAGFSLPLAVDSRLPIMTMLDINASVDFLRQMHPNGPWVVTAIAIHKKGIETRTYFPDGEDDMRKWLGLIAQSCNCYWHVNPVMGTVNKKASKENIKEMAFLHVDIDPRTGEGLEAEHVRIQKILTAPPFSIPLPTAVVFSGGGFQAFWKLTTPLPIAGRSADARNAERYNIYLQNCFGADSCHNVDRLMRLPGTVNFPDENKVKKGRSVQQARVVSMDMNRVYPIGTFQQSPEDTLGPEDPLSLVANPRITLPDNVRRVTSVDELNAWNVPERVRVMIVQGMVPFETKSGDNSRSGWLFDCVCQLARCAVPDDVIYSIITDPGFQISESVLALGSKAKKYALRQIERAKEEVISPWLRKLNERHAVIANFGGKCRVIEEVKDDNIERSRLAHQSFDDFNNRYCHIQVEMGQDRNGVPQQMPVGRWWLKNPLRRQYDSVTFAPGRETPGRYNLWKGFSCPAEPGDCHLYLEHVRENICNGEQDLYDYVLGWMARAVQQPDCQGEVALMLRGRMGTGKGIFARTFGDLFGRHFVHVADPRHLTGNFNAHLRDCVVLFADEAFFAGDVQHASVLKRMITEPTNILEAKGFDSEVGPNYTHLILASNSQWVIPAGSDERRYFAVDVSEARKQDSEYFEAIVKEIKNGGDSALLHFLQNYDIKNFQVRNVPQTKALMDQKMLSMPVEDEWWYRKLFEGKVMRKHPSWLALVPREELYNDYLNYMDSIHVNRRCNETNFGRFLARVCPGIEIVQRRMEVQSELDGYAGASQHAPGNGADREYFFSIPPVHVAREAWRKSFRCSKFEEIKNI